MSQWHEDEVEHIRVSHHREECARNYDYGWWLGLVVGLVVGVPVGAFAVLWSMAK